MKKLAFLVLAVILMPLAYADNDLFTSFDKNEVRYIKNNKRHPDQAYQARLRSSSQWQQFLAENGTWYVVFNEQNTKPHRAFGKPISVSGATARERAENFIQTRLDVFELPTEQLKFISAVSSGNYDYVRFTQNYQGLEVLNSLLYVKLTPSGSVITFGADIYSNINVELEPSISNSEATEIAQSGIDMEITSTTIMGDLKVLPIPKNKESDYRLVYEVEVKVKASSGIPAIYYTLVDAHSGEVLYRQNKVKHVDGEHEAHNPPFLPGGVDVSVTGTLHPTNFYEPTAISPLAYLRVDQNGTNNTDVNGNLSGLNSGSAEFHLEGLWSTVKTGNTTPSFTANLSSGQNNISFDNNANIKELSAYYSVNIVHDYMKTKLPSFTGLDFSLETNIDVGGECNAFYDGSSINFYPAGGGCNPTSLVGDVVYHEYGHGINDFFYTSIGANFSNGAMGEGYADVWALGITEHPILGKGFYDDNENGIRRYDIDPKVYPQDLVGEVHADGEIIAGAWWDLGQNFGDMQQMFDLFIEAYFAGITGPDGNEGEIFTDVLIETLQADDVPSNGGDNDITNGTPNAQAIVDAFAIHGITLLSNATLNHNDISEANANDDITIDATIILQFAWALEDAKLFYKINRTGQWNEAVLNNTSGNNYTATIPAQQQGTLICYYLGLESTGGVLSGVTPIQANATDPNIPYFILVGCELFHKEDFDTFQGDWTEGVQSDEAVTGQWVIDVPIGSFYEGDPVQTNVQHTPGGIACAITGNANNTSAGLGENDVDDGETTLITPVFDLSDHDNPIFVYWRWFTNDPPTSANPGNDVWEVEITGDGGSSWERVERTYTSDRSWRRYAFRVLDYLPSLTSDVQIRFVAEDSLIFDQGLEFDGGSLVEAAIDDLELYDTKASGVKENISVAYINVYPNPTSSNFNLDFTLMEDQDLNIELFNNMGQVVYTNRSGRLGVGSHRFTVSTDDLADGIYMLQLSSDKGTITKRVSIIR